MSARPDRSAQLMPSRALSRLLAPRSIAIVGASAETGNINGQLLANLQRRGFRGALYPVNPKYSTLAGLRCFPSVDALPEAPDLAVVLLSAARAVSAVDDCGRRGVPFAIVIGAGFAELKGEGERLQEELLEAAKRHGMRLLGPNCIGLMNVPDDVFAGFGPVFGLKDLKSGGVSMSTQSGGFGFAVVNMAEELGIGFRYVVSTGNEADLTSLDLFDAFIDDPGTEVLAGYFEGMRDAYRLRDVGRRALLARKPVVVWKVGSTPEGERAAASHTGSMGGSDRLFRAAFDQYGWIRIDDVHQLVDAVSAFARGKLAPSSAVGIVTVSGGAGVLLADACAACGLSVPALSARTVLRLREVLPAYASPVNPVDVTASILNDSGLLNAALRILLEDDAIGSLIVVASSVEGAGAERIAHDLVNIDKQSDKPVFVSWSSRESRVGEAYEILRQAKVPLYRTPSRACWALGALGRFSAAVRRSAKTDLSEQVPARERVTAPPADCNEYEAKRFLARYGLQAATEAVAASGHEAARVASEIGYPVAVKILSPDIAHKTEVGGVRLKLTDDAAVMAAFEEMVERAKKSVPLANIQGVLVQEMLEDGVEVIVGAVNRPPFGPVVMVGLGGIFAELLDDAVFRLAPVDAQEARAMVASLRSVERLRGARGYPKADTEALVAAILGVSDAIVAHESEIEELDINPLVVLPEGRGVRVVDALVRRRSPQ